MLSRSFAKFFLSPRRFQPRFVSQGTDSVTPGQSYQKPVTKKSEFDITNLNYNAAFNPDTLKDVKPTSIEDTTSSGMNKTPKQPNKSATSQASQQNEMAADETAIPLPNDQNTPGRSGTDRGSPDHQPQTGY